MAQHRKQCHIMCKLWCQLISVQNHRQGVEDLRNAHFLPVSGSRSWEMPDCAFELVDDRQFEILAHALLEAEASGHHTVFDKVSLLGYGADKGRDVVVRD